MERGRDGGRRTVGKEGRKEERRKQRQPGSPTLWHTPLISALRGQRQADLCEFLANLVYIGNSRML